MREVYILVLESTVNIFFSGKNVYRKIKNLEFLKNNQGGSLKIHLENGRIQEERTYPKSSDPKKSKG